MSAHGFLSRREIINHRKITANTAKEGITQAQKTQITQNTAKPAIDWTTSQAANIHQDNYTNTVYSVGDNGLTEKNFTTVLFNKLDGIENNATVSPWTTGTGTDIYYNTGNVGIGATTTPEEKLHVHGKIRTGTAVIGDIAFDDGGGPYDVAVFAHEENHTWTKYALAQKSGGDTILNADSGKKITFGINGSGKMYLSSSGYVGIGTSGPVCPLHVDAETNLNLAVNESWTLEQGNSTYYNYWHAWPSRFNMTRPMDAQSSNSPWTSEGIILNSTAYNRNSEEVSIKAKGTIWTNRRYFVSSDRRIKMEIEDVNDTEALDIVNKIPCRKYYYKDPHRQRSPDKTIGFIAQEVKEHLPEAISLETEMIPDELLYIENPIWNENVLTIENLVFTDKHTGKCTFEVRDGESGIGKTIELTVNDDKKSFTFEKHWNYVVLTQKEVNDFHTLDKNLIFALHHAALQEVDRQLQAEKVKTATLEAKTATLEAKTATLETTVADLVARIAALENA